ncbi:MAG: hypothetical protein ABFD15_06620 [Methanofastidiosum sp.]
MNKKVINFLASFEENIFGIFSILFIIPVIIVLSNAYIAVFYLHLTVAQEFGFAIWPATAYTILMSMIINWALRKKKHLAPSARANNVNIESIPMETLFLRIESLEKTVRHLEKDLCIIKEAQSIKAIKENNPNEPKVTNAITSMDLKE